jgi:xanthine dehydrogenase iron-sulfur cluster and FAD-binding subunit A
MPEGPCAAVYAERGAGADGTLHPVRQGVIYEQGFQWAFWIPCFVMATVGFLKINPGSTRAELPSRSSSCSPTRRGRNP